MKTNSRTTVVCGPIRHSLLTDLLDGDYFQKYFQFFDPLKKAFFI